MSDGRCAGCGATGFHEASDTVAFALPQCGVVARVDVPARRCGACGEVRVAPAALGRAHLAVGCALADHGVQTGDAFRQMRRALGLRAADLARLLDLTPETISHWETGRATPGRGAFIAVAAMVQEALEGGSATRDRLAVLSERRPWPRALALDVRAPRRR